jgi:hypothetical protein
VAATKASTADVKKLLDGSGEKTLGGFPIKPVEGMTGTFNALIYGDSGVGKTTLAGSASVVDQLSPVLFIDAEGGTMSLAHSYPKVDTIRIMNLNDLQKVYNDLHKGEHPYKTIVVDSLTEVQKMSMTSIMRKAKSADADIDLDMPQIQHWGKNLSQTRATVRAWRDLPYNVILTALAESDKDNRNRTVVRPSLTGKAKGEIPGFMDIVLYYYIKMDKERNKRLLLTTQTDSVMAKDRSGKLPSVMEEPTMTDIYSAIYTTEATA